MHRFRVRFGRERRASRLPCLSVGLGDDGRSTSGSGDVSLTIFITSAAAAKALRLTLTASSTLVGHQVLGLCLILPKGMENLAAFSVREVKSFAFESQVESRVIDVESQVESSYFVQTTRVKSSLFFYYDSSLSCIHSQCLVCCDCNCNRIF